MIRRDRDWFVRKQPKREFYGEGEPFEKTGVQKNTVKRKVSEGDLRGNKIRNSADHRKKKKEPRLEPQKDQPQKEVGRKKKTKKQTKTHTKQKKKRKHTKNQPKKTKTHHKTTYNKKKQQKKQKQTKTQNNNAPDPQPHRKKKKHKKKTNQATKPEFESNSQQHLLGRPLSDKYVKNFQCQEIGMSVEKKKNDILGINQLILLNRLKRIVREQGVKISIWGGCVLRTSEGTWFGEGSYHLSYKKEVRRKNSIGQCFSKNVRSLSHGRTTKSGELRRHVDGKSRKKKGGG